MTRSILLMLGIALAAIGAEAQTPDLGTGCAGTPRGTCTLDWSDGTGSIHNPLARGCHALLRQGAKLVETADDIISELAPLTGHMLQSATDSVAEDEPSLTLDDDYADLRQLLSHDPLTIDELAAQSSLTIEQLSSMLLILELHGEVESLSGGRYALAG